MEVAAKLMAAERETAWTPGLLVSRPRELALKVLEGKVNRRTKLVRVFALFLFFIAAPSFGADGHYPGKSWERLSEPEKLGWPPGKLTAARDYAAWINTAAVMVILAGQVLDE